MDRHVRAGNKTFPNPQGGLDQPLGIGKDFFFFFSFSSGFGRMGLIGHVTVCIWGKPGVKYKMTKRILSYTFLGQISRSSIPAMKIVHPVMAITTRPQVNALIK